MPSVRDIEQLLFREFPREDAVHDDRIGLLVGSTESKVTGIALALDAKRSTIEAAADKGCNVLVTHHPVFWHPPTQFLREGPSAAAAIYAAAELGVALIAMHTNLDCAPAARELLLKPVGFTYTAALSLSSETEEELQHAASFNGRSSENEGQAIPSLGQLAEPQDGIAVTLGELTIRYKEAFGAVAKAWGNPDKLIKLLASCSGGGGSLVQRVIDVGANCYVTGEVAYHEALELAAAGVTLIELGHDRSELPYRYYLRDALTAAGFDKKMLYIMDPVISWWQ